MSRLPDYVGGYADLDTAPDYEPLQLRGVSTKALTASI